VAGRRRRGCTQVSLGLAEISHSCFVGTLQPSPAPIDVKQNPMTDMLHRARAQPRTSQSKGHRQVIDWLTIHMTRSAGHGVSAQVWQ
jgi:hypothetical protein